MLAEATAEANVALLLFRAADKFARWSSRESQVPYVLLTDWRDVKPLHQYALNGLARRPIFTVVMEDQDSPLFNRAAAWAARGEPLAQNVYVCADLALLMDYLAGLHHHLIGTHDRHLRDQGRPNGDGTIPTAYAQDPRGAEDRGQAAASASSIPAEDSGDGGHAATAQVPADIEAPNLAHQCLVLTMIALEHEAEARRARSPAPAEIPLPFTGWGNGDNGRRPPDPQQPVVGHQGSAAVPEWMAQLELVNL